MQHVGRKMILYWMDTKGGRGWKDKKVSGNKLYFSHAHKLEIGIIQFKYQYQDLNEKWTWLKRIIAAKT